MTRNIDERILELRTKLAESIARNKTLRAKLARSKAENKRSSFNNNNIPSDIVDEVEIMRRVQRGIENSLKMHPSPYSSIIKHKFKRKLVPGKFR